MKISYLCQFIVLLNETNIFEFITREQQLIDHDELVMRNGVRDCARGDDAKHDGPCAVGNTQDHAEPRLEVDATHNNKKGLPVCTLK